MRQDLGNAFAKLFAPDWQTECHSGFASTSGPAQYGRQCNGLNNCGPRVQQRVTKGRLKERAALQFWELPNLESSRLHQVAELVRHVMIRKDYADGLAQSIGNR